MRRVLPFPNDRLMELLRAEIMPNGNQSSEESVEFFLEARHTMATYPVALQEALIPLLENDPDRHYYRFLAEAIEEDIPHVVVNEYVTYHQHISEQATATYLLGALRHYPNLPALDDYSTATTEVQGQIKALFTVTSKLRAEAKERFGRSYKTADRHDIPRNMPLSTVKLSRPAHGLVRATIITSEPLIQIIIDNPGKAGQIADIVIQRETVDTDLIDSIINSATQSVATGTL